MILAYYYLNNYRTVRRIDKINLGFAIKRIHLSYSLSIAECAATEAKHPLSFRGLPRYSPARSGPMENRNLTRRTTVPAYNVIDYKVISVPPESFSSRHDIRKNRQNVFVLFNNITPSKRLRSQCLLENE